VVVFNNAWALKSIIIMSVIYMHIILISVYIYEVVILLDREGGVVDVFGKIMGLTFERTFRFKLRLRLLRVVRMDGHFRGGN